MSSSTEDMDIKKYEKYKLPLQGHSHKSSISMFSFLDECDPNVNLNSRAKALINFPSCNGTCAKFSTNLLYFLLGSKVVISGLGS